MKIIVFSSKPYDIESLEAANAALPQSERHRLSFLETQLNSQTAALANSFDAVCAFVNDELDQPCLDGLSQAGIQLIAPRCAGFNNVDMAHAQQIGMPVARVPAYSPHAVAEHAVALMLTLNRHIHRAFNRVREGNFSLQGLQGFDMHGKTVGILGTGRIGTEVARIMRGFGCRVIATDTAPNNACRELGVEYMPFENLLAQADIITIHCPLTPDTFHIIDDKAVANMRDGVMLINTGRGAIIETTAVIKALKSGKLGYLGLDVYEQEEELFFQDLSNSIIQDDLFERLLTFPNVLVTGHQGFFTQQALQNIAMTTLENCRQFECGEALTNAIHIS